MSSTDRQPTIRPAFQVMLVFLLLGLGIGFYFNWSNTGSFIGHGFSKESIESIEQDIKVHYEKKKGTKVTEVALIREAPTKLTGFVKFRVRSGNIIFQTCTATLGETGNALWGCKSD